MSTRRERKVRRNRSRCRNCGEFGAHFIPPSFGDPGFYACEPAAPVSPEPINQETP